MVRSQCICGVSLHSWYSCSNCYKRLNPLIKGTGNSRFMLSTRTTVSDFSPIIASIQAINEKIVRLLFKPVLVSEKH